jgi:opacity protein-like surface antigen
MKQLISNLLKTGCGCALLCAGLSVYGQKTGFYVKGDLGGNLMNDIDVKEFLGANIPNTKIELDPGFRAGIGGGYQFVDWAAAEAELGFMANSIHDMTGATHIHDATIGNVPFLVNVKLQLPPMGRCPVTPYIGAGVGFSETFFDVDVLEFRDASGNIYGISGSDSDAVFAWQAFAGLRYRLNERMGLGIEYRYFQAESPSWEADFTVGTASNTVKFGRTQTHAFSVVFDFRF